LLSITLDQPGADEYLTALFCEAREGLVNGMKLFGLGLTE
jgi:hypothetical protein